MQQPTDTKGWESLLLTLKTERHNCRYTADTHLEHAKTFTQEGMIALWAKKSTVMGIGAIISATLAVAQLEAVKPYVNLYSYGFVLVVCLLLVVYGYFLVPSLETQKQYEEAGEKWRELANDMGKLRHDVIDTGFSFPIANFVSRRDALFLKKAELAATLPTTNNAAYVIARNKLNEYFEQQDIAIDTNFINSK